MTIPHYRVLLVDSNAESLALMTELFRPFGFELLVARTPAEALGLAAQMLPHAVYLDMDVPDCDGWELAARLRSLPCMQNAMLVGMVDEAQGGIVAQGAGERGLDYYLPKLPRMRDIVNALNWTPPVAPDADS